MQEFTNVTFNQRNLKEIRGLPKSSRASELRELSTVSVHQGAPKKRLLGGLIKPFFEISLQSHWNLVKPIHYFKR